MSPSQDRSTRQRNQLQDNKQETGRRGRQPRSRECLLKGCGKKFRPRHPMARYCSEECRLKARQWSQWKSRQRWRQSENGRKKRKQQSVRHRERLRLAGRATSRRENAARGSSQAAPPNFFWRHLRSPGLLRVFSEKPAFAKATILLPPLRAGIRARVGARETMEGARANADLASEEPFGPIRVTAIMSARTSGHIAESETFS